MNCPDAPFSPSNHRTILPDRARTRDGKENASEIEEDAMSAKSAVVILALLTALLFLPSGCGPFVEVVRLDQSTKADVRREVGIYNAIGPDKYQAIKPLKATACQNRAGDPVPSWTDAVDQLRYKAWVLGTNGITDLKCSHLEGDSLAKNCWSSVTCEATAIKIGSEAARAIMTPEEMREEMSRKVEVMREKEEMACAECKQKTSSFVESVQCSNPAILNAHRDAGDPYMDLMQLFAAHRIALAERLDKGEITEAEAGVAIQELIVRLNQERRQRDAQQRVELRQQALEAEQQNARMQAYGALFQELGTWQIASKPRQFSASPAPQNDSIASPGSSSAPIKPSRSNKGTEQSYNQGALLVWPHALKKKNNKADELKTILGSRRLGNRLAFYSNRGATGSYTKPSPGHKGVGLNVYRKDQERTDGLGKKAAIETATYIPYNGSEFQSRLEAGIAAIGGIADRGAVVKWSSGHEVKYVPLPPGMAVE